MSLWRFRSNSIRACSRGMAGPVYVATYVAIVILSICLDSSELIHRLSWRLPIGPMANGTSFILTYSDTEQQDNQNKKRIYRRTHSWDKGCPYKIPGGGIRPAPIGEKDDEDPRTNNARRAKLRSEHETPG